MNKLATFGAALLLTLVAATQASELGDIDFPNSGDAAAQPAFLEGVKALHSFQFDEAGVAFRAAQAADADFALAYWGEAMSNNKPLWGIQNTDEARAILERLGTTAAARQQAAATAKEKAWLAAAEQLFFSPGDKLERDQAYSDALQLMHERWPDDHEIAVFYALSLLGTVRPGDQGFRRQAQAAAICLEVFGENPNHPGAAHFIIHSFDDPDHAVLALPAARVYADIAPAAAHALHMPSHIFLQLGMWSEVVKSNTEAYEAAWNLNQRLNLPEGREDFHTLSWLAYGNLMLGHVERAAANLERAREAVARNPGDGRVLSGYLNMRARHLLEAGADQVPELAPAASPEGSHANWLNAVGLVAAQHGETDTADGARSRLERLAADAAAAGNDYDARQLTVLALQVDAALEQARGATDAALATAREAAELELTLGAPSGPPVPTKPAWELYGEMLLAAGRVQEAQTAFEQSLDWIPERTPSLLGLARAAVAAGKPDVALTNYRTVVEMPGVNAAGDAAREASANLD